jgi:uncharacterized protein (TIGR02596 family)
MVEPDPVTAMKQKSSSSLRGFSLIELLAVMSIIAIIAAATLPAVTGVMKGSTISEAGLIVADKLKEGAEQSLALHSVVEVRFYSYPDASVKGGTAFQALQIYKVSFNPDSTDANNQTTYTPLGPVVTLPKPAIMLTGQAGNGNDYSSLLDLGTSASLSSGTEPLPALPILGSNYTYLRFAFHPNGTTDLPPGNPGAATPPLYYVTVAPPEPSPPQDFYTIAVDPVSGKVTTYRP